VVAPQPDLVTLDGWKTLDRYEKERGTAQGRPRVKITSVDDMLEIIKG